MTRKGADAKIRLDGIGIYCGWRVFSGMGSDSSWAHQLEWWIASLRYFLADRVVEMTVEMFREPRKMVQEISGLGLRHVAWHRFPDLTWIFNDFYGFYGFLHCLKVQNVPVFGTQNPAVSPGGLGYSTRALRSLHLWCCGVSTCHVSWWKSLVLEWHGGTLLETNSSPLKIGNPKRKRSYSNHPFSGANC